MGSVLVLVAVAVAAVTGLLAWASASGRTRRLWVVTAVMVAVAAASLFSRAGTSEAEQFRMELAIVLGPLLLLSGVIHVGHLAGAPRLATALVAFTAALAAVLGSLLWSLQERIG